MKIEVEIDELREGHINDIAHLMRGMGFQEDTEGQLESCLRAFIGKSARLLMTGDIEKGFVEEGDGAIGANIGDKVIADAMNIPQLKRGMVWCTRCGRSQRVDSEGCLRTGWPECCGGTMTIDSPEEREKRMR